MKQLSTFAKATIGIMLLNFICIGGLAYWGIKQRGLPSFNTDRAYQDVITQVNFGPRTVGSDAHARATTWIEQSLVDAGWQVDQQHAEMMGHPILNLTARRDDAPPKIIIAAHYDSRLFADNDPDESKRTQPVPGANDGASGVAVLLELARSLPADTVSVWLVFFDAEDNGRIEGWDWILGSRAYVAEMTVRPEAVIIVDMIGDADLDLYIEESSTETLAASIWQQAILSGYGSTFAPEKKYTILDDHTPFLEAGIPAVDIIDIEYPYWHTTQDTPDKVSPESLKAVGETLLQWIINYKSE